MPDVGIVIALAGVRRSGKNTVGGYLDSVHGFKQTAFADPMKHAAKIMFPQLTEEQLFGSSSHREEALTAPLRGLDPRDGGTMIETADGWLAKDGIHYPKYLTPRLILQTLGTEWGRRLHKDVWGDACWGYIRSQVERGILNWTITDCRFRNEITTTKKNGGVVVKLLRGFDEARAAADAGDGASAHPSEVEFLNTPDSEFDYIIDNRGSLEDLPAAIDGMLLHVTREQKSGLGSL